MCFLFFQAEDGIRDIGVTGVQTCALPISSGTATLLRLHPSHEPHLRRLPPLRVRPPASGVAHSRGVTGGVYKARERIHRGNADPRLLATPPSCRRVSAYNPNRDAL